MSTRVKAPGVPSSSTPDMAVHPAGSGSEVQAPVPPEIVPTPGTAPAAAAPGSSLVSALDVFVTGFTLLASALDAYIQRLAPGQRVGSVRSDHVAAAPVIAALMRTESALGHVGDPHVIDTGVAELARVRAVSSLLKNLASALDDTGRLSFSAGWQVAGRVVALGNHIAKTDKAMAQAMAPVQALLARGPQTATAPVTAAKTQQNAGTLAARTVRAQQKADAAAARAAARHPSVPSSHQGNSPVPLANPQGPAASANVNPQGPAPGR